MDICELVQHIPETAEQSSSKMNLLSKVRCITVDVTGTLIAYKGELGDYYCMAAKSVGLPCPDYKRVHEGFKLAYSDMAKKYPCFGHAAKMPNIVWWKTCVRDSFVRVKLITSSCIFGHGFLCYLTFPTLSTFFSRSVGCPILVISSSNCLP